MPQLILADKSDLFRRSMSSVLSREGYEVLTADAGSKLLAMAQSGAPTAIILDVDLEDPSGLETLKLLKGDPRLRKLPVLVVSRESAPTAVSNAFKMGAESFLLKPIDLNALVKSLESLRVPIPALNAPIEVAIGEKKHVGRLRFLDQYGQIYLDKSSPDLIGTPSSLVQLTFEASRIVYRQWAMIDEEHHEGISLVPVGAPSPKETPELSSVPVALKCRYMTPGTFMRLADVSELTAKTVVLRNLAAEPRFNSEITLTLYPRSGSSDDGVALTGKVESFRGSDPTSYEATVDLGEQPGLPYVQLMSELIGGRPPRPPQEAK